MHPNEYVLAQRTTINGEKVIVTEIVPHLHDEAVKLGAAYVEALQEQRQRQLDALR